MAMELRPILSKLGLKSLRSQMYVWLIAPMAVLAIGNILISHYDALDMARNSVDHKLLSSARMIGENLKVEDGYLHVEIPPAAIENLQTAAADRVYYRIDRYPSGLLAGSSDLPRPHDKLAPEAWKSFESTLGDKPLRAVVYAQQIFSSPNTDIAMIQVATTKGELDDLVRRSWSRSAWHYIVLLTVATLLSHLWIKAMLAPISRISNTVRDQQTRPSARLDAQDVPTEMLPLIDSLNYHMDRVGHYISEHDRFISNAAHQMKTPITILNMQTTVGLRSNDLDSKHKALTANYQTLQQFIRSAEQLLALSTANHKLSSSIPKKHFNLLDVVKTELENLVELADKKNIDLGLLPGAETAQVHGVVTLVGAMVSNLIDNAIRYTPEGGMVTVSVSEKPDGTYLEVEDSGPGIAADEREKVFERYYRLSNSSAIQGTGLGLAIVREIALSMNTRVELHHRPDGQPGLLARVIFPHVDVVADAQTRRAS
jgi:two-component system sensor histidine kinase TctE